MFTFFESLINPFPDEEPERPPNTLRDFCIHYCRGAWPWLILMSVLSAVIAVVEVQLVGYLGHIVDVLAENDKNVAIAELLPNYLWVLLVVLFIYPLLAILQTLLVHQTLLGNLPMIIRWQAHRYLLGHSLRFFNNEFAGRIGTKVMQTSLAVRETVMKLLDILVYVGVYFLSILWLVASSDPRLMLPLLLWLAFYLSVLRYFVPKLQVVAQAQADARSMMTGRVIDSYTNISTVKLFSHAGNEARYAREGMDSFMQTVHRQMRLSTQFQLCVDLSAMVLLAVMGMFGVYLWKIDAVGVGAIAIAVGLVIRLHGMSHWIMWEMSALFENIGIVKDGITTLSTHRDVVDHPNAGTLSATQGNIEFRNVEFNYGKLTETATGASKGVLENLNLKIPAGQKTGLVGRSGAGKTTLVNVLLRLYDVEKGQVLIDDQNVSSVTQDSLRANIGVVTQDTSLLHRSIFENIAYGRQSATREEVEHAAGRANALEFIQDLEDHQGRRGFSAHVGERGVTLSGGQRQRIAIARVFLKDAPILVLDEATSALDSEVEAAIQENLLALMEGKTVIAIAHRLSTISALDNLIIMDEGKIVEQGTHDQLANAGGLYQQLWQRQSGGFIASGPEQNTD